jgi:O-methyltransferase
MKRPYFLKEFLAMPSLRSMIKPLSGVIKPIVNKAGIDIVGHSPSNMDPRFPADFDRLMIETIVRVKPFTMTSKERLFALCEAVKYVSKHSIPGDIVECGVWKGGSMMAAALTLMSLEDIRKLYLFDTYEGMSEPTAQDMMLGADSASSLLRQRDKNEDDPIWCYSPLEKVKEAVYSTGYPQESIEFVKGKVEDTIPGTMPDAIALLRLDTDWYESTKHEMEHLFPRISPGGILIIDDYGWWDGARQAVDEYIEANNIKIFLNRIDSTGRIALVN